VGSYYSLFLSFEGTVKRFSAGNFSSDYSFDIFGNEGDGLCGYIYADIGKLFVYDHNRNVLFSGGVTCTRISKPVTFSFSSTEKGIGFYYTEKKLKFFD
jgi:hypothetical protein